MELRYAILQQALVLGFPLALTGLFNVRLLLGQFPASGFACMHGLRGMGHTQQKALGNFQAPLILYIAPELWFNRLE